MNDFTISKSQLEAARAVFRDGSTEELTRIAIAINTEQPNFTAVMLALELCGLDRTQVEDMLESIFVVYYAQTRLNKRRLRAVSEAHVFKNSRKFAAFIADYEKKKAQFPIEDFDIKYLRDETVILFAMEILQRVFPDGVIMPKEVVIGYVALLKGIEEAAEESN
jgi:hypothetical protein